jgi:hypothetical protein
MCRANWHAMSTFINMFFLLSTWEDIGIRSIGSEPSHDVISIPEVQAASLSFYAVHIKMSSRIQRLAAYETPQTLFVLFLFASAAVSSSPSPSDNGSSNKHPYSHAFYVPPQHNMFLQIARKHGTDKVTRHFYEHLYSKYFETSGKRFLPLKMIEIGLGRSHGQHSIHLQRSVGL